MACSTDYPADDNLFVNQEVYRWKRWDELAIAAYWVGSFQESCDIYQMLLKENLIPNDQLSRVRQNIKYAEDKK